MIYNNLFISSFEYTLYYCAQLQIFAAFCLHHCDNIVLHSLDYFHSGFDMNIIANYQKTVRPRIFYISQQSRENLSCIFEELLQRQFGKNQAFSA